MAEEIKIEDKYILIGFGVATGLILILVGIVVYLLVSVHKLKKKNKKEEDDDDNESFDDESSKAQTVNNQPYNQHVYEESNNVVTPYKVNPYNPLETYQIRRAKLEQSLMQSLRNKITPSHSRAEQDYNQPIDSHMEDDYPHPKNGTLKNEILYARSKIVKKPPAPKEWINPGHRRSYTEKPTTSSGDTEFGYPPKDYPGFPYNRNLQLKKPYAQSVDNYPTRNHRPGMSRKETEVMNEYDRTIANEERSFNPYSQGPGYGHGNRYGK